MANIKVGQLIYEITSQTDKGFSTNVKKADKSIDQLGDSAEKSAKKTGGLTGKLTAMKVAVVAVAGVILSKFVQGIKESITLASNLEESINAVTVVFGEGADGILKFGEKAATSVGLAASEYNQLATSTGALLKDTGIPLNEVADLTNDLAVRAADMASVFNTDVKDALSAINQALRGETEAIRRYAGNVTDTSLQQFLLTKGINKTTAELTEQEKRLYRVQLIMEQTADTAGDFNDTSDSLANRTRILSAQFKDLKGRLGDELVPIVTRLVGFIGRLVDNFDQIAATTKRILKPLGLVTIALVTYQLTVKAIIALRGIGGVISAVGTSALGAIKGVTSLNGVLAVMRTRLIALRALQVPIVSAFGAIAAALVISTIKIVKAVRKLRKARKELAEIQKQGVEIATKLVNKSQEVLRSALDSGNERVIALAQANLAKAEALQENASNERLKILTDEVRGARDLLNDDNEASNIWKDIHKSNEEEVNDINMDDFNDALDTSNESVGKGKTKLEEYNETLKTTQEEATKTKDALNKELSGAFDEFGKSLEDTVQETTNGLAEITIKAEEEAENLRQSIKNADSSDERSDLKDQLAEVQTVLDAREGYEERHAERVLQIRAKLEDAGIDPDSAGLESLTNQRDLEAEIEEQKRVASLDEFTRFEEQQNLKLISLTDNFIAETTLLKEKIATQEKLEGDLTAFLQSTNASRTQAVVSFVDTSIAKYQSMGVELKKLIALQGQLGGGGASKPQFHTGGYVDGRGGDVHAGEYVMPASMVRSMPQLVSQLEGMRGGTTISPTVNISGTMGNNVSTEELVSRLGYEMNKIR